MRKSPNRRNRTQLANKKQKSSKLETEKPVFLTKDPTANTKSRLFLVWGILMVASIAIGINLYNLQIVRGPQLKEKARNQQMANVRPYIPRRSIIDRNGDTLAVDLSVYTLSARPKLIGKSSHEVASKLAIILNKDPAELEKKLQSKDNIVQLVDTPLPEQIADQIFSLHLNGIELIQKYSRLYPQQKLDSDVVGFVNVDRLGQAGVERSTQKLLERSVNKGVPTAEGMSAPDYAPDGFLNIDNDLRLQLTIDNRLQRTARAALKEQIDKFHAKRGAVIVMDAWDGSLLAMTCEPTYNPNEYFKADVSLFKNWTVADLYEPGSTFKPLNVAIALQAGVIKPDDTFNDPGFIRVADRTIKDAEHERFGQINVAQILQHSSNVGMVQIIQRMHPSYYYGALEKIGLGQTVDTDLPFAVSSQIKNQEEFINTPIESATASFGQGFSLTPLQLVQMLGALANGGKLVAPHVVRGLIDTKGQLYYSPTLAPPRPIFTSKITQKVIEMMQTVVDEGTGKESQIPGYHIAGKTGTAQKASKNGGYSHSAVIASFVGILPVEAPRYVVLALVDEPKGKDAYGGSVAAPIAKSVLEALISTQKIPPSRLMTTTP